MIRRISAAACALAALAACDVVPQVDDEVATAPPPIRTGPTTVAVPAAAPTPTPSGPVDFVLEGEFTQGGWLRGIAPAGTQSLALGDAPVVLSEKGRFFAAFDRDAGGSVRLSAVKADGSVQSRQLTVAPRDWDIEYVDVARRAGGMSDAYWKVREPELAAINEARAQRTGSDGWTQDFLWPATGRISGRFGSQRVYRGEPGSYHSGLDIARPTGTLFISPADGVVVLSRPGFSLEGNLLIIDHGMGLNSAFLHANSLDVREGDVVRRGQRLGTIGSSGRATGPHLHWSLKWNDARLDPLLFVGPMP